MKPNTLALLAAGGGFLAGAALVAVASKKAQAMQAAAVQAQLAANAPNLQLVTSTGSLSNGWMYFLQLAAPGSDLTQDTSAVTSALTSAGFVDPSTKGSPALKVDPNDKTHVLAGPAVYNGVTGTSMPASTASLQWVNAFGYPPPAVLSA